MKIQMQKPPTYILSVVSAFCMSAVLLFFAAVLISLNVLSYKTAQVFVILSVITASILGSFILVKRSGAASDGYIFAVIYFITILMVSFVQHGSDCFNATLVKHIISIFCGTIFGNFIGKRRHYKLRNFGKKRLRTTK